MSLKRKIRIVEQPASRALRFRYECEGPSAGSIPGVSSTREKKTFPTIEILGHYRKAIVIVSCVTKDPPHRPHPHNLVGREGCQKGICKLEISPGLRIVQFPNLGIQCVRKKDIEHSLTVREAIRVDPFKTGFAHRDNPSTIDLNVVRLCFQVIIEGSVPAKCSVPLRPVVSDPIYDKKALADLSIYRMSDCTSYVDGGKKNMILLCEKVSKENIQVRFYEANGDWEAFADFHPMQVFKQHAIWFKTPKYKNVEVTDPVKVLIQLRRPSDGATSESLPFELLPASSEHRRERPKIDNPGQILKHLQDHETRKQVEMDAMEVQPQNISPSPHQSSLSPFQGVNLQYDTDFTKTPNYQYQPNVRGNAQSSLNTPTFGNTCQQQMWNTGINLQQSDVNMINSNVQPQYTSTLSGASMVVAGTSTITTNNFGESLLNDSDTEQVDSGEIERMLEECSELPDCCQIDSSVFESDIES